MTYSSIATGRGAHPSDWFFICNSVRWTNKLKNKRLRRQSYINYTVGGVIVNSGSRAKYRLFLTPLEYEMTWDGDISTINISSLQT